MNLSKPALINGHTHIPYQFKPLSPEETKSKSVTFYHELNSRRSIRQFSSQPVEKEVIATILKTAGTSPSGAHKQPWHFCCVSNPEIKREIRMAAEQEERESYASRMSERWLNDLKPIGTDWQKPFIEEAPWIIAVFKKIYDFDADGQKTNNYYVNESVGIACGILIAAIHQAGLATLTHTPSPMNFLTKILDRPENEKPYLLLPIGYPKDGVLVPDFKRKSLDEISTFIE